MTLAQVSVSYLVMSGGDPATALICDGAGNTHHALNVVVREDRRNDPRILRFISTCRSPEVKTFITEHYGKFITLVW